MALKRLFRSVLLSAAVALLVILITSSSFAGRKITLVYATWHSGESLQEDLKRFAMFMEKNPDIEIQTLTAPYGEYPDKMLTMFAGGNAPDTMAIMDEQLGDLLVRNVLTPLDDYLNFDDFYSQKASVDAFLWKGRLYTLTWTAEPIIFAYNKTLFNKAGVSYPTDDWMWSDFLEAAKKLTIRDQRGVATQFGANVYALTAEGELSWLPYLWQNGTDMLSDNNTRQIISDNSKAIESIQWLLDLYNTHKVTPRPGEAQEGMDFLTGKVAMSPNMGAWDFSSLRGNPYVDLGLTRSMTAYRGGPRSDFAWMHKAAVPALAKNKKEAVLFIKYLISHETQKWLSDNQITTSVLKSVVSADPWFKKVREQLITAGGSPILPGFWAFLDFCSQEQQKLLLGRTTPREFSRSIGNYLNSQVLPMVR